MSLKRIALFSLIITALVFTLPQEKTTEGYCPSAGSMRNSGGGGSNNPPPAASRPSLSVGLQPRVQSLRIPGGGSFAGVAENWEVWWTLNREKYLDFRKPVEWVSIKEGATRSITKHKIYEELYAIISSSLDSKDQTLAWNSAIALGRSGDLNAIPLLKKAYQENKQILVKDYSTLALGWLRDKSAIEILKEIAFNKKEQEVVRSHAAAALGYIPDEASIQLLKDIIADKDAKKMADVTAAAVIALGLSKDTSATSLLGGLLNGSGQERIDSRVRCYAALSLGRLGTADAFKELKKTVTDKDKDVRISTTIALGLLSEPTVKDELATLLKDKDGTIRGLAAVSLAQLAVRTKLESKPIFDLLAKTLKDTKSLEGDGLIVIAMGLLGDESAKAEFKNIMENRKKRQLLKCAVVIAAGLMKDKEMVPTLIEMLAKQPDDPISAPYIILALGIIGDEKAIDAIKPLWEKADKNILAAAYTNMAVALTMLGQRAEVITQLKNHAAKDQQNTLRQYALHTLGLVGDRESAQTFVDLYKDENSDTIKTYIITGIGLMMEKSPLPLIALLTSDNNTEVATLIIDHLLPLPTW